jgi:hypothetical protein
LLKTAGIDPTAQNLGIAHAFGGAGAAGILKFPDQASLPQVLQVTHTGSKSTATVLSCCRNLQDSEQMV